MSYGYRTLTELGIAINFQLAETKHTISRDFIFIWPKHSFQK